MDTLFLESPWRRKSKTLFGGAGTQRDVVKTKVELGLPLRA